MTISGLTANARVGFTVAALLLLPAAASPATFTVSPTQVFLTPKATSALLTLRNESDEPVRFQLTLFKWNQSAEGEMELMPTEDIVFFPKLLELAKGEERKVRVGTTLPFGSVEQTYRIFIEELPPSGPSDPAVGGVRMRTRMGVPIFLQPAKATAGAAVVGLAVEGGHVRLRLENRGTVHFIVDNLRVSGLTTEGALIFSKVVDGWYVLAGRSQTFDIPLEDAECLGVTTVTVEARIGGTSVKDQLARPATGCQPAAGR